MDGRALAAARAAVEHIESHLTEKLTLEAVAAAARYSPFHLHRLFLAALGMPPHAYARRRRLTEAARALACGERPIAEIALDFGYASQQSLSDAIRAMYKRSPGQLRREGAFYPLMLPLWPEPRPEMRAARVRRADAADVPAWLSLAKTCVDGHPRLEAEAFRAEIEARIRAGEALVLEAGDALCAALTFDRAAATIGFCGARPACRSAEAIAPLLRALRAGELRGREIGATSFRPEDRADNGQRARLAALGFCPGAHAEEYGYPTQRFALPPDAPL